MKRWMAIAITGALASLGLVVACSTETITTTSCGEGSQLCGSSCTVLARDPENCGACGTKCGSAEVCNAGKCATSCSVGATQCGSSCVNAQSDPMNCGGCGTVCAEGEKCVAGKCTLSCQVGLTACTAPVVDAGAADATSDVAVDASKDAVSDATSEASIDASIDASTDAGALGATFCANLATDNQNCGACGKVCGPGTACIGGTCAASCGNGSTLCTPDGGVPYCANLGSDNLNCGQCGNKCPSGKYCSLGGCVAPTCVQANGLNWCFANDACGEACNAVCTKFGMTPVSAQTWFAAQNTLQLCQNISVALGLGTSVQFMTFVYACLEDSGGTHTVGGGLVAPLFCSTDPNCPQQHLTTMDQGGTACGANSRRSICPCK